MAVELNCPNCSECFETHSRTTSSEMLDRFTREDASFFLGDGETFEDMIYHHFSEQGEIACPECGEQIFLNEENLGQLASSILNHW